MLIVDDSPTARYALRKALGEPADDLVVIAEASNAAEALAAIRAHAPDVVTMDVHLGPEDGVDLAALIMATVPTPILVVTGVDPKDPGLAFRAMQAGALEVVAKLPGTNHPDYASSRKRLVRTVRALSSVPVVTRRRAAAAAKAPAAPPPPQRAEIVVIGASTGGPPALAALLSAIPRPFPIPIVIAQHVTENFGAMLANWLGGATGHRVFVCPDRHDPRPGDVILAPDHAHLVVNPQGGLSVQPGAHRNYQRPSIDMLFETAAAAYGRRVVGVLMTGMGSDGAAGLLALRVAGAYTIAQEPSTCVVDSMPSSAIALGAACAVLPVERIASAFGGLATNPTPAGR